MAGTLDAAVIAAGALLTGVPTRGAFGPARSVALKPVELAS